jgi:Na+-transporting methylmalonyl-CoA/oxaloacetate decarboxylase gamma subunit
MLTWIAGVSLVLSVLSFVLFAATIVGSVLRKAPSKGQLEGTETSRSEQPEKRARTRASWGLTAACRSHS